MVGLSNNIKTLTREDVQQQSLAKDALMKETARLEQEWKERLLLEVIHFGIDPDLGARASTPSEHTKLKQREASWKHLGKMRERERQEAKLGEFLTRRSSREVLVMVLSHLSRSVRDDVVGKKPSPKLNYPASAHFSKGRPPRGTQRCRSSFVLGRKESPSSSRAVTRRTDQRAPLDVKAEVDVFETATLDFTDSQHSAFIPRSGGGHGTTGTNAERNKDNARPVGVANGLHRASAASDPRLSIPASRYPALSFPSYHVTNALPGETTDSLQNKELLTETTIDAYLDLIRPLTGQRIFIAETTLWQSLSLGLDIEDALKSREEKLRRADEVPNPFDIDLFLMPICSRYHYRGIIFDMLEKTVEIYDPYRPLQPEYLVIGGNQEILKICIAFLHQSHWAKFNLAFDSSGWKFIQDQTAPIQPPLNGTCCGVYLIQHMREVLFGERWNLEEDTLEEVRNRMVDEISNGCLERSLSPESTLVYASPRLVLLDQSVMERWLLESDMKYMQYDHELRLKHRHELESLNNANLWDSTRKPGAAQAFQNLRQTQSSQLHPSSNSKQVTASSDDRTLPVDSRRASFAKPSNQSRTTKNVSSGRRADPKQNPSINESASSCEADSEEDEEEQFDKEKAEEGWKLLEGGEDLRKAVKTGKSLPKVPKNPKRYLAEGKRDCVVLEKDVVAENPNEVWRKALAGQIEQICIEALTEHDSQLDSQLDRSSGPATVALEASASIAELVDFTSGVYAEVQTLASAAEDPSVAVSPFGRSALEGLIVGLRKKEDEGELPGGIAASTVDLFSSLPLKNELKGRVGTDPLLQVFKTTLEAVRTLVSKYFAKSPKDVRDSALATVDDGVFPWTGFILDPFAYLSNYAPTDSLANIDHGIADDSWTGKKMAEKGKTVCDCSLIDANGFAASPYDPALSSQREVRTTPVAAIDGEDGSGVEIRGLATRAFWDSAALITKYRQRAGVVDILVGPQAQSLALAAARANSKEGFAFIEVEIPMALVGIENDEGCYRDTVSSISVIVVYSTELPHRTTYIGIMIPMWCAGHAGAVYFEGRINLTRSQLADLGEAIVYYLKTGRELSRRRRSNLAQSSRPGLARQVIPNFSTYLGIQMGLLRQAEKEFQASLDPRRPILNGFEYMSLPIRVRSAYREEFDDEIAPECDFIAFDQLPVALKSLYQQQAKEKPGKYRYKLLGVTPLEAHMSFKALRAVATLRKTGEYQLGELIDGAKARGRLAAAIRSSNNDTLVWAPLAAFVWHRRSTLLKAGRVSVRTQTKSVLLEVESLRQQLDSMGNTDFDRHLELDDLQIRRRTRRGLESFRPTYVEDFLHEFDQPQVKQQVGPLRWNELAAFVWPNRATLLNYGRLDKKKNPPQRAIALNATALRARLAADRNNSFNEHLKLGDEDLRRNIRRSMLDAFPGRADQYRRETNEAPVKAQPQPKKSSGPTPRLAPSKSTPQLGISKPANQSKPSQGSESNSKPPKHPATAPFKSVSKRPVQTVVIEDSDDEDKDETNGKRGGTEQDHGSSESGVRKKQDRTDGNPSNSQQNELSTKRERSYVTEDNARKRPRRSNRVQDLNFVDRSRTIDLFNTRIVDMSRYQGSWIEFEAVDEASKSKIIDSFLVEMAALGLEVDVEEHGDDQDESEEDGHEFDGQDEEEYEEEEYLAMEDVVRGSEESYGTRSGTRADGIETMVLSDSEDQEMCGGGDASQQTPPHPVLPLTTPSSCTAIDLSTFGFPSSTNLPLLAETVIEHGISSTEELTTVLETFPEDVVTWMGKKGRFTEMEIVEFADFIAQHANDDL